MTMHIKLPFYSERILERCRELSAVNLLVIIEDNLGIRNLTRVFLKVLMTNKMGLKRVTKLLLHSYSLSAIGTLSIFVNTGLKDFYKDHAVVLTFLYSLFDRLFKDLRSLMSFPLLIEKFKIPAFSLTS